jgi:RimJ/RimL family protein N-acetyltransferase
MRSAILHLAFDGLGAREALSASFEDNPRSERISRSLGYEPNGTLLVAREGAAVRSYRWRLTRERWHERRRAEITVEGVQPCLELLGASEAG